jgi:N utilization substance protein B
LFAVDLAGGSYDAVMRDHFAFLAASAEGREFAQLLVRGVAEQAGAIDDMIRKVSEHWRLERMPRVDRNILRLSAYELMFMSDVPRRVTLNEAIELAKRYAGEGSPGFVNGVLDRIATEVGK